MTAQCQYFGVCGGCQNQHVPYEEQLENKRKRVAYLLSQYYTGEVKAIGTEPYSYRNRMDFIVAPGAIGFRQSDERKLVDITQCPISEPRLNTLLEEVRAFLNKNQQLERYDRKNKSGVLRYAVIRVAQDTCISFVFNEDSTKLALAQEIVREFASNTTADHVVIAYVPSSSDESVSLECFAVKGQEYLTAIFCGKTITYHSQAFFQNNTKMAQNLVQHVADLILTRQSSTRMLVDAYGGVGTFGVVLAQQCKEVLSIESHPLGTQGCERNIQLNGVNNMRAVNEDAANLKKFIIPQDAIILLDPPRSGLSDKTMRYLFEKKHQTIVYVSCNPSQLAKELAQLTKHYTVESAAVFDLFAQTNHSEAVVLLERKTT